MYQLAKFAMTRIAAKVDPAIPWAKAVVAAGGAVSAGRQAMVSGLIAGLQADGIWGKFDRLWMLAAENTQSALIDLKALDQASPVNSPTFAMDRGYAGNGSSSYVNTTFNPSTQGAQITLNDASIFLWNMSERAGSGNIPGFSTGGGAGEFRMNPRDGSNNMLSGVCSENTLTSAVSGSSGLSHGVRRAAGALENYKNGVSIGTGNAPAQGVINLEWYVGCWNAFGSAGQFITDQISICGGGASFNGTQAAALYTRLRDYLASINTVLLLHGDGADASTTITDSTARHTVTPGSGVEIDTAQSKFGGASILHAVSSNGFNVGTSADYNFPSGTDFTIDLWIRPVTVTGATQGLFYSDSGVSYGLEINTSGKLIYKASNTAQITGTTTLSTNTWQHVALTRSGTSTRLFLNGTQEGSTYSDANNYTNANFTFGVYQGGGGAFNGHTEEIRIVKGFAVWTANFTPPTAPYVVGAYEPDYVPSVLLLHGNGTDASTTITDSSASAHTVTPVGNAQIDTAQSVFGGASILFDGTGDRLTIAGSTALTLATGDFTVDFRVRLSSGSTSGVRGLIEIPSPGSGDQWSVYIDTAQLRYYSNGVLIGSNAVMAADTWYHVALIRLGGRHTLFQDGVSVGTWEGARNYGQGTMTIGGQSGQDFGGWIEELRVVKGFAIWTDNFAVPISAYSR